MDEILDIAVVVARAFDRSGVPYLVGGSLASSLHGIPRSTLDVDFVAQMDEGAVPTFVQQLGGAFYLDEDAIRDAVKRRASFNLIHLRSYLKADVFVAKDDEAFRLQMQRRQRISLGDATASEIVVASPEDVVAQKLAWFALGDEISERQWTDAIGVLKVSAPVLDRAYLRHIAGLLHVEELLERAYREAGITNA